MKLLHSALGRIHAHGVIFDIWWAIKALNPSELCTAGPTGKRNKL